MESKLKLMYERKPTNKESFESCEYVTKYSNSGYDIFIIEDSPLRVNVVGKEFNSPVIYAGLYSGGINVPAFRNFKAI